MKERMSCDNGGRELRGRGAPARRMPPAPLLVVLAVGAFALYLWHIYYSSAFRGLIYNDAQDYASIARNVALGKGFISQYLTPLGLAHFGVPQPDIWRAPLWPLLLAAFQRVFGFIDEASALAGGFCFSAGACLTFLLGRRWFNTPVALAAVFLYIFSGQLLSFSISGLTEPLAVLLMLGWLCLLTAVRPGRRWQPFLAGIGGGVFYLARYNAVLFFLPALVYLYRSRRRTGADRRGFCEDVLSGGTGGSPGTAGKQCRFTALIALFILGFLLAAGPWLWRNYALTGNPFFSLQKYEPVMFTRTHPDYSLYRKAEIVDVAGFLFSHPEEVGEKVAAGWREFARNFWKPEFTGVALPVFVLFLLSLVLPLDRRFPAQRGVRPLVVACFLLQLAALLPLHYIPRLFIIFAPLFMIYACGAVWWLAAGAAGLAAIRIPRLPALLAGILGIVLLAGFTFSGVRANYPDFQPELGGPHPRFLREEAISDVKRVLPRDQVVVSDTGHIFAWYGERSACKLPFSPGDLPELTRLAPVGALFLSNWITWSSPDADPAWVKLYLSRPPHLHGLRLSRVYPDGSLLYLAE